MPPSRKSFASAGWKPAPTRGANCKSARWLPPILDGRTTPSFDSSRVNQIAQGLHRYLCGHLATATALCLAVCPPPALTPEPPSLLPRPYGAACLFCACAFLIGMALLILSGLRPSRCLPTGFPSSWEAATAFTMSRPCPWRYDSRRKPRPPPSPRQGRRRQRQHRDKTPPRRR